MKTIKSVIDQTPHVDKIEDITGQRPCPVFHPRENVKAIICEMKAQHFGAAGVVDAAGDLVGMVTEGEILRRLFDFTPETAEQERFADDDKPIGDLTAWDVMIAAPERLTEGVAVEEALKVIHDKGYRFMPVVSQSHAHKLLGIVSERELLFFSQAKAQRLLEAKDSLLSYFMHHESYGKGSTL